MICATKPMYTDCSTMLLVCTRLAGSCSNNSVLRMTRSDGREKSILMPSASPQQVTGDFLLFLLAVLHVAQQLSNSH